MVIDDGWVVLTKKNHNNNDRILRMSPLTNLSCDDMSFIRGFSGIFIFVIFFFLLILLFLGNFSFN